MYETIIMWYIYFIISGWCGSTNSCITGNNVGPFEPCVKGQFIFAQPEPNFNPQARIVNDNVGGVQMTVISK